MARSHPLFAAVYDRLAAPLERAGLAERRRRLLAQARGDVLEVGGGTGANLAYYPGTVERICILEPDVAMRRRLLDRVAGASVTVEVHEAPIEEAPFPDRSFDTVVATLVLCTVRDQTAALAAIRRLLRPDGVLLFLEHVRDVGGRGLLQVAVAPAWERVFAGCRPDRDTVAALRRAGFSVTDCDRFRMALGGPVGSGAEGVARLQPAVAA